MIKKIFIILLTFVMIAGAASCGDGGTQAGSVTTAETGGSDSTIDYENLTLLERLQIDYNTVPDDLPDADYEGYTFRLHTTGKSDDILGNADNTSEVVGDAVYQRRIEIEDRFNIKFTDFLVSYNDDYNTYVKLMNSVFLSQDDAFDLMAVWNTTAGLFTKQNFFTDLSQIETIDFDKPWFFNKAVDALSYKNHAFVSVDLMQVIYG